MRSCDSSISNLYCLLYHYLINVLSHGNFTINIVHTINSYKNLKFTKLKMRHIKLNKHQIKQVITISSVRCKVDSL